MAKRIRGPVQRGAVVNVHHARGGYSMKKAIVIGVVPPDDFSRAYGRQVFVCNFYSDGPSISEVGSRDAVVVGKVKKLPAACKRALAEYKAGR